MQISTKMSGENQIKRIQELRKNREISRFLRLSIALLIIAILWSWTAETLHESVISEEQRTQNLNNFLKKIVPDPTRDSGNWSDSLPWISKIIFDEEALMASLMTFGLATTAIWISASMAFILLPLAARNLATNRPLGVNESTNLWMAIFWKLINKLSRLVFLFTRSLPEYVLGFLLLSILGPDPWALVLALAIHNIGILGRLGSEIIENNQSETPRTFIAQGSSRLNSYISALIPETFSRMLIYYFYRWETCVRESTVLGMLGIASLGFLINEAKAGRDFDKMIALIIMGSLIVILGDLFSYWIRKKLRLNNA